MDPLDKPEDDEKVDFYSPFLYPDDFNMHYPIYYSSLSPTIITRFITYRHHPVYPGDPENCLLTKLNSRLPGQAGQRR